MWQLAFIKLKVPRDRLKHMGTSKLKDIPAKNENEKKRLSHSCSNGGGRCTGREKAEDI
jgi:hypothetical protein